MTDTKSKKVNQWLIDRAYNMKVENADRTYKLLSYIKAIKDGKYTEEEGMTLAADEGCVVNLDRYKQSTATGLRCFGLVSAAFETTEIAEAYLNKYINFNDLILLQLIKKETKYDENADVLRPLFIILKVLLAIREIDGEECWVDGYDYFTYLTEIKKYSEINDTAAAIVSDRKNSRTLNYKVNDYDIWVNALLSTNLFMEVGNAKLIENTKITINEKYLDLIKFLVNSESKLPIINEYEKNKGTRKEQKEKQELYGLFSNGLYTMLPKIELKEEFFVDNLTVDYRQILYLYLFEGLSYRAIEQKLYGTDFDVRGFFVGKIIESFGISSDYKGIWKPFINNVDLIKNHGEYKKLGRIYNCLFGNDDDFGKIADNCSTQGVEWIMPANHNLFDHVLAFEEKGFIHWTQRANFNVGDIVYLYSTSPLKRISMVAKVEQINLAIDEIDDFSKYWKNNNANSTDKYMKITKLRDLNIAELELSYLLRNGLSAAPQSSQKISKELSTYIHTLMNGKEILVSRKIVYTYNSNINACRNLIVYGTPGCGKSYYVKNSLIKEKGIPEERVVRTTFYQDYTNTDFVGQVMPKVDGEKVTYEFNPGPFTIALRKAIETPDEEVVLVIEELNRGNAPSIFGDIFQLLDRKNGLSEYEIVNVNIQDYLNKYFKDKGYTFEYIKLPGNLSIYATMNTSDQNVFTLDTAFKRRWEFKKLTNKFDDTHTFAQYFVPGMVNYTWKDVVESVNEYIADNSDALMNEDKQIGVYFVEKETLAKTADEATQEKVEAFAYKLLEYLWDDVVKFDRSKMFKNAKTFDQLVAEYQVNGEGVFVDGIIKHH